MPSTCEPVSSLWTAKPRLRSRALSRSRWAMAVGASPSRSRDRDPKSSMWCQKSELSPARALTTGVGLPCTSSRSIGQFTSQPVAMLVRLMWAR
eukprot:16180525-Heterocapsa_arctica.AAC.1